LSEKLNASPDRARFYGTIPFACGTRRMTLQPDAPEARLAAFILLSQAAERSYTSAVPATRQCSSSSPSLPSALRAALSDTTFGACM
jgi:hypothetical protein